MKTIFELCEPRASVFDTNKIQDTLDLIDFNQGKINAQDFFEENFFTKGMGILLKTAFERFNKNNPRGVIKLTQSMGGGKTHNMIALGLLAKQPSLRKKYFPQLFKQDNGLEVKVIAFSGRESPEFGLWGELAEQLDKKENFDRFYSPLGAPGESDWVKLLKSEKPILILMDELPPYLNASRGKEIGNSDLSEITGIALANLYNALSRDELSNVLLVISNLEASYESGSEQIRTIFKDAANELNRHALDIIPVDQTTGEIYDILKKRLFKILPNRNDPQNIREIKEIVDGYANSIKETKEMGFTMLEPDGIRTGITENYPFHPILKDLFARFKENQGFQQTRGIIRLTRQIIKDLWNNKNSYPNKYLINPQDLDFSNSDTLVMVQQINQNLVNAISKDIYNVEGESFSQQIEAKNKNSKASCLLKLILVSSFSTAERAIIGLSRSEILFNMSAPDVKIGEVSKDLEELETNCWYLQRNEKENRFFFADTVNLVAHVNELAATYSNEDAKNIIKYYLKEGFNIDINNGIYKNLYVFPLIDEIKLEINSISLVICEPKENSNDLPADALNFWNGQNYKNRVMFLTGQGKNLEYLWEKANKYKAIKSVYDRKSEDNSKKTDDYIKTEEMFIRINMELLSALQEAFSILFYPTENNLKQVNFTFILVTAKQNSIDEKPLTTFRGEDSIKNVLAKVKKIYDGVINKEEEDTTKKRLEADIFTQQVYTWKGILEKCACEGKFPWYPEGKLEKVKEYSIKTGGWRLQSAGYLEKGPFSDKTEVEIKDIYVIDPGTSEIELELNAIHGDLIYYSEKENFDINSTPFKKNHETITTKAYKLYFLAIDSTREHKTGEKYPWTNNKIILLHQENYTEVTLKSSIENSNFEIKYTTNGSSAEASGLIYKNSFSAPENSTINAVLIDKITGKKIDGLIIKIENGIKKPKEDKELTLEGISLEKNSTEDTYKFLKNLEKYKVLLSNFKIELFNSSSSYLTIRAGEIAPLTVEKIKNIIEQNRENIFGLLEVSVKITVSILKFPSGKDYLNWLKDIGETRDKFERNWRQ